MRSNKAGGISTGKRLGLVFIVFTFVRDFDIFSTPEEKHADI